MKFQTVRVRWGNIVWCLTHARFKSVRVVRCYLMILDASSPARDLNQGAGSKGQHDGPLHYGAIKRLDLDSVLRSIACTLTPQHQERVTSREDVCGGFYWPSFLLQ